MSAPTLILCIDTCGAVGTLALGKIEENVTVNITVTVAVDELPGRTFASLLVPRISEILDKAGTQLDEVAAIAVVHGPGSFTGVRIGVAAAKALAEASGKPLIAISRLAVLCAVAKIDGLCWGLLDAGRGELYAGAYRESECFGERLMSREEVLSLLPGATLVAAEAAVAAAFPNVEVLTVRSPVAADALPLAARRLRQGIYDDVATLDGNYLRRTDTELFAKPQSRVLRTPAS